MSLVLVSHGKDVNKYITILLYKGCRQINISVLHKVSLHKHLCSLCLETQV